jgi:hypothetical protein
VVKVGDYDAAAANRVERNSSNTELLKLICNGTNDVWVWAQDTASSGLAFLLASFGPCKHSGLPRGTSSRSINPASDDLCCQPGKRGWIGALDLSQNCSWLPRKSDDLYSIQYLDP